LTESILLIIAVELALLTFGGFCLTVVACWSLLKTEPNKSPSLFMLPAGMSEEDLLKSMTKQPKDDSAEGGPSGHYM
jgi:hypothetical protein